ncbi:PBSX family phage terminase, large subunit [Enterococcus sp. 6C8_DIV0013]|uniref:PBSX family phage terminase large subunit n=1 Tax=Vagococcus fluvialis TaxID=2738 RepID=UPI000B6A1043|nr:PBSX family phage terminase large subunit [Vagococcus fluvialis]OTP29518.1 PBSX family phage terminase, large subunit [Enterococcus sp. 6C8_DIV0013]
MATTNKPKIQIRVQFNKNFKPYNECRLRYRLAKGSAGSGKSVNTAQDYILKLGDPRYQGANLLCVRKVDGSNKDSTFAELKSAIFSIYGSNYKKYWKIKLSPMMLESKVTGNQVIFRGMKDEGQREKVKSITFDRGDLTWIWVEEATELYEADVDILDDRLRGKLPNPNLFYQMTFTFNPVSATHWLKAKYFDIKHEDIFTHQSTYLENRFIDDAYHKRMMMRKVRDPDGYRIYGLGEWGEAGGLILSNYEIHEFDTSPECFDYMVTAQDFGFNHANAIGVIGFKDGEIYLCKEIYEYEKDTSELIQIANKQEIPKNLVMWCDSAEPDRIKMWQKAGYKARPVKKEPGSIAAQIDYLKQNRIHIHTDCIWTTKEIQQWKWRKDEKTNKYTDEPVNFFDDAMAMLRYSIEFERRNVQPVKKRRKERSTAF